MQPEFIEIVSRRIDNVEADKNVRAALSFYMLSLAPLSNNKPERQTPP